MNSTGFLISAALMLCSTAFANAQEVTTIELGQTITKNKGTATDLYRFGGEAGTAITVTFDGTGKAALTVYTPTGEEMLSSAGTDNVTLTAILPLTHVFLLGVVRDDALQPYTIKTSADEPDIHQERFSEYVGYRTGQPGRTSVQCWVDPGHKIRITYDNGAVSEGTIGRGGKKYYTRTYQGRTMSYEVHERVEGSEIVTIYTGDRTEVRRSPIEVDYDANNLIFVSYMCDK